MNISQKTILISTLNADRSVGQTLLCTAVIMQENHESSVLSPSESSLLLRGDPFPFLHSIVKTLKPWFICLDCLSGGKAAFHALSSDPQFFHSIVFFKIMEETQPK